MAETQAITNIISKSNDTMSNAFGVTNISDKKVTEGKHYIYTKVYVCSASTDYMNVFLVGGGSTKAKRNIKVEATGDKPFIIYLRENVLTSGGGGSTVAPINCNRVSTLNSAHSVISLPTTKTSSTGTNLWIGGAGAYGGYTGTNTKFILNSSEDYAVIVKPSTDDVTVQLSVEWDEVS
jgi:hypothetical protein